MRINPGSLPPVTLDNGRWVFMIRCRCPICAGGPVAVWRDLEPDVECARSV